LRIATFIVVPFIALTVVLSLNGQAGAVSLQNGVIQYRGLDVIRVALETNCYGIYRAGHMQFGLELSSFRVKKGDSLICSDLENKDFGRKFYPKVNFSYDEILSPHLAVRWLKGEVRLSNSEVFKRLKSKSNDLAQAKYSLDSKSIELLLPRGLKSDQMRKLLVDGAGFDDRLYKEVRGVTPHSPVLLRPYGGAGSGSVTVGQWIAIRRGAGSVWSPNEIANLFKKAGITFTLTDFGEMLSEAFTPSQLRKLMSK